MIAPATAPLLAEAVTRLRLLDDEMMRTALQDQTELVQYILRIILRKPGLTVTRMETQKDLIQLGDGRSLALDVWAVNTDDTEYNIEIQKAKSGADPHRPRYHLSLMDSTHLRKSEEVRGLPATKVIFITEEDCIGDGELIEEFVFRNVRGRELKTDQEVIYLNTAYNGTIQKEDEDLAALAHDFRCSDPDNMALDPLKKRMQFLKSTKEGKAQMSSVVQQYAEQYALEHEEEIGIKYLQQHEEEIGKKYVQDHGDELLEERIVSRACDFYRENSYDIDTVASMFRVSALRAVCGPLQANI